MLIFFCAGVVGAIGTVAAHRDPGFLLGFMIIVGSAIAALCIRRKAVYLLIPLPALTYLVLAFVTGYIHDHAMGTSKTALASDAAQWLGGGFIGIVVATVLVLLIFGARLLASRQLVSGQFSMSGQHSPGERFPRVPMSPPSRSDRGPRRDRAPWDNPDPWNDRGGAGEDSRDASDRRSGWGGGAGRDEIGGRGPRDRGRRDRQGERDPWYEQPRSGSRGRQAGSERQRTRALPPSRDTPPGRGPNRDVPPGRPPRQTNDDPWRG